MILPVYHQFLLEQAKTHLIPHSGRTLFLHLYGTYNLLRSWDADEEVCLAGLFHSIYGTRHFKHKAWPLKDRGAIRAVIGREAEWLAYLFCATARPKAFLEAATAGEPWVVRDLFRDSDLMLTPRELCDLLEIETANLIEQNTRSLRVLKRLCEGGISVKAQQAIKHHVDLASRSQQVDQQTAADHHKA